jgi:site-specific DNA-methyltransferase (adenine-specific)
MEETKKLELNKIYCMDALEFLSKIKEGVVDMVLCDLPYGTTACEWDKVLNLNELWKQYKRILKEDGVVVLTASQPFTTDLINSNRDWFKYDLIWNKKRPTGMFNAKIMPMRLHEHILIFYKSVGTFNPQMLPKPIEFQRPNRVKKAIKKPTAESECWGTKPKYAEDYDDTIKNPVSILEYSSINNFSNKRKHPTEKPLDLFKWLIKSYSNEGDLVIDNCIGSGTTAVACKQTNRNFIGCDISQEYVDITNKRLNQSVLTSIPPTSKDVGILEVFL